MRLAGERQPDWQNRSHFFAIASRAMRQILVDHARKHKSGKRGGGGPKAPLEEALSFAPQQSSEVLALDDALTALAAVDPRKCQIIELRFFGGLSVPETAQALDLSVATIGREQRLAEAWLHRELNERG